MTCGDYDWPLHQKPSPQEVHRCFTHSGAVFS